MAKKPRRYSKEITISEEEWLWYCYQRGSFSKIYKDIKGKIEIGETETIQTVTHNNDTVAYNIALDHSNPDTDEMMGKYCEVEDVQWEKSGKYIKIFWKEIRKKY